MSSTTTRANYIDSTPLVVCHNRRRQRNEAFQHLARTGLSLMNWFFGFKLHALINQQGQLVVFSVTAANVADNDHTLLERLTGRLDGFLYGGKGYHQAGSAAQGKGAGAHHPL